MEGKKMNRENVALAILGCRFSSCCTIQMNTKLFLFKNITMSTLLQMEGLLTISFLPLYPSQKQGLKKRV